MSPCAALHGSGSPAALSRQADHHRSTLRLHAASAPAAPTAKTRASCSNQTAQRTPIALLLCRLAMQ